MELDDGRGRRSEPLGARSNRLPPSADPWFHFALVFMKYRPNDVLLPASWHVVLWFLCSSGRHHLVREAPTWASLSCALSSRV